MMKRLPKQRIHARRSVFSLIELIAVIVVLGILTGIGVAGLRTVVTGLHRGKQTLERTQKAQIALQRIILELRFVQSETGTGDPDITISAGGTRVDYRSKRDGAYHSIEFVDPLLEYDGYTLVNSVQSFLVESAGSAIKVTLTMLDIGTFSVEVYP